MEILAITEWNGLVSPVYDMSCRILVRAGSERGVIHDVSRMSIGEKALLCADEKVTTLICGAISRTAEQLLTDKGIVVISWICGSVESIIVAYTTGGDLKNEYAMPGCRLHRCRNRQNRCTNDTKRHRCGTGKTIQT